MDLAGYSGVDVILGGDESLALVDGALASTTQEADLHSINLMELRYAADTGFPKDAPANHSISRGTIISTALRVT